MNFIDRDNPPGIPRQLAICPICGQGLVLEEITEWETDTGRITEIGFHVNCSTEPDIDDEAWNNWHNWHWSNSYSDWLPIYRRVYDWLSRRYRVRT